MKKGKLKIYFGYAAGVGKTFAMLEGAREVQKSGIDVVSGYIEPHNRPETSKLIEGLETLPLKKLNYKGIQLKEFNLEEALIRRPQVILVDELAHTNCHGSRNKKRFQDIEELLKAGIDVFTTINIQHLEGLNDVIEKITGIIVNEKIPDYIFEEADQIELIDIEPVDLLERLDKGKIYQLNKVNQAKENFFTLEKLIALREIALRKTADQVNKSAIRKAQNKKNIYAKEHVLVCVSASPSASHVIHAAARLAVAFKAEFTALYIGDLENSSKEEKDRLRQNLRLAEQLGAKLSVLYGDNVSKQIVEYAKISQISKLVIGKSVQSSFWSRENIVDLISQEAPELDIYVIPNARGQQKNTSGTLYNFKKIRFSLSDLLKTILMLVLVTSCGLAFKYWNFNVANIIMLYILGVQINAIFTKGRIFSLISSVLSVLCFNYFFTEPYYTFVAFSSNYPITFLIMLAAGLITSTLIKRIQEQVRVSAEKSYRTEVLLQTNKDLAQVDSVAEILEATVQQLKKLLDRDIVIYPIKDKVLGDESYFSTESSKYNLEKYQNFNERGVAEWVMHNNKRAGATTNTLSAANYLYLSIRGKNQSFAVIGILMKDKNELETFEKSIILAILGEAGLALEKEILREVQQKNEIQIEQEQLRVNLLRAISHDLRTPLTSISGHAKLLMKNDSTINKLQIQELSAYIYDDSMWLINLVENLLSITRLDEKIELKLEANIIDEVVEEALKHVDRHLEQHEFSLNLADELLMAKMDVALMIQVIVNLINNAVKYTPINSKIELQTKKINDELVLEVSDNGPGITDKAKEKIFDLFYTDENRQVDSKRGLGLGLSLCKSIILAHGGQIYVKDNQPNGAIFGFKLPLEGVLISDEQ